jgi:hypothetical protein
MRLRAEGFRHADEAMYASLPAAEEVCRVPTVVRMAKEKPAFLLGI